MLTIRGHFVLCTLAILAALPLPVIADEPMPPTTVDGLELVPDRSLQLSYRRRGVHFSEYAGAIIDPVQAAYGDEWLAANRRMAGGRRDRIRNDVATALRTRLTEEFRSKGIFEIATAPRPDVLRVSVVIGDLFVTAADRSSSRDGLTFGFARTSGLLVVEVRDPASDLVIARMADRARADRMQTGEYFVEAGQRTDTEWVIRRWVEGIRDELESAKRASP